MREYFRWLHDRGLSVNTIANHRSTIGRFQAWLHEHHDVALLEADRPHLRAWRTEMRSAKDEPLEVGSILGYLATVRSFYRWATVYEQMDRDPTLGLPIPKQPRRIPRPIDEERMEYAIDLATGKTRQYLVLEGYAGIRACEISTMHRSRIFEHAPERHMVVIAKGGGERVVWISDYVWSEIRQDLPRRGYVYLRKDRTDHVAAATVTKMQNGHLHACGIEETAHQLRHRFGTQSQQTSKDLRLTQEMMGHADPRTTAGYAAISNPAAMQVVMQIQPKGWRDGLRPVADAPWPGLEDTSKR